MPMPADEARDRELLGRMEDTEHWPLGGREGLCDAIENVIDGLPCMNKATHRPRILVAAIGYVFKEDSPATLSMFMGLKVCTDHRRGPEHYVTAKGMEQIDEALQKARPGAVPLDWNHVEMRHDPL